MRTPSRIPALVVLVVCIVNGSDAFSSISTRTGRIPPAVAVRNTPKLRLESSAVTWLDPTVATASVLATAKLLTGIALGGWAASSSILDASAISALARLVYHIFQPAFLLCSVGQTLYTAAANSGGLSTRFLLLMPLTAALQIALGFLVGQWVTRVVTKFEDQEEARNVRMCTTFANSGPIPLVFCEALLGGSSLASPVAACISFYLLVWSPLFWSAGKFILGTPSALLARSNGNGTKSLLEQFKSGLQSFLSPPVIGSLLGLGIGICPPLRNAFFSKRGIASPLYGSLQMLGTAYIPAALLVLAGSLVQSGSSNSTDGQASSEQTPSKRAISTIFVSKFVVSPALSFGLLHVLGQLGWLGPVGTRARAIVSFTLLMEGCTPPAQNSVVILQLEGLRARASSMAKLLTILYVAAVVPVTILLSMCLAKSNILAFQ
jgi:auxin efflux carrier family protein